MAKGEDDQKSSWSSWFKPGDSRSAEEPHRQTEDHDLKRPATSNIEHAPKTSHDQVDESRSLPGLSPLIAFKHLVDDSFAAISNFSHNIAEPRRDAREYQVASQHIKDTASDVAYERWTGIAGLCPSMDEWERHAQWQMQNLPRINFMHRPETIEAVQLLLNESTRRNSHIELSKLGALFTDPECNTGHIVEQASPWPIHYAMSAYDRHNTVPSPAHWLSIDWFKHSPYSPVNLEADPALGKYDTKWRHAFEDLLEAALDKPMTSQERFGYRSNLSGRLSTWRGPGLDWMLSLLCRGILPPTLAQSSDYAKLHMEIGTPALQDVEEGSNSVNEARLEVPDNELDFYEYINQANHSNWNQNKLREADVQGRDSVGRCPDNLGRAIGDTARQEAARAFADEENGLTDGQARSLEVEKGVTDDPLDSFDFESFLAGDGDSGFPKGKEGSMSALEARLNARLDRLEEELTERLDYSEGAMVDYFERKLDVLRRSSAGAQQKTLSNCHEPAEGNPSFESESEGASSGQSSDNRALQDYQMQLMLLEQQNKKRLLMARQELESMNADMPSPDSNEKSGSQILEKGNSQPAILPTSGQTDSIRPQVLSTLTTTRTTRLPDGSVKTEVVLKRRFSDGHEETQESTQMSFDQPTTSTAGDSGPSENKKGWFWS